MPPVTFILQPSISVTVLHTSSGFQITQAITPVTLERLDCLLVVYKVNLSWVSLIDKLFLYPELITHNVPKHLGLQKVYFCCLPQNIICFLKLLFLHLCYIHSKAWIYHTDQHQTIIHIKFKPDQQTQKTTHPTLKQNRQWPKPGKTFQGKSLL